MSNKKIAKHLIDVCKATERPPFPIGIIVSDGELSNIPSFIEVRKEAPLGSRMPVLVAGKKKAEAVFKGVKLKYLDKTVVQHPFGWVVGESLGQFWTFAPTEHYCDYVPDVCRFIEYSINQYYSLIQPYFSEEQLENGEDVEYWVKVAELYGVQSD